MLIVYLEKLNAFGKRHANASKSIVAWVSMTEDANWRNKQDFLKTFPGGKIISVDRARFEILHNTYRLVAKVHYNAQIVEVRFIGTHSEYDRINPSTI